MAILGMVLAQSDSKASIGGSPSAPELKPAGVGGLQGSADIYARRGETSIKPSIRWND